MTAREFFESARTAQRMIDARLASLSAMRAREGMRAQAFGPVGRGPSGSDTMRATAARMDAEAEGLADIARLEAEVREAREACAGFSAANPRSVGGAALELHFLDMLTWGEAGRSMGMTGEGARRAAYAALDWIDAHGIAATKAGRGSADDAV